MPKHVADQGEAPASPLDHLRHAIDQTKAAPLLHKGERAGEAMDSAFGLLADLHGRLDAIESRIDAITHPARDVPSERGPDGRFRRPM